MKDCNHAGDLTLHEKDQTITCNVCGETFTGFALVYIWLNRGLAIVEPTNPAWESGQTFKRIG